MFVKIGYKGPIRTNSTFIGGKAILYWTAFIYFAVYVGGSHVHFTCEQLPIDSCATFNANQDASDMRTQFCLVCFTAMIHISTRGSAIC